MRESPTVVKVGGSLFDLPDLAARLEAWLKSLRRREIVLVPGGGAVAEFVRDADRTHGLGEEKAHWLALRALGVTADLLATLLAGRAFDDFGDLEEAWQSPRVPILDPYRFACRDESSPGRLPHCWDVSSDSLAARVAEVVEARELVLLKSVTIPPDMDWGEASRRRFVDAYFPTMVARGVRARAVNLREWRP